MAYQDFLQQVVDSITPELPPETGIRIEQITKNNGQVLDGLIISEPKTNIYPTIYLNPYFQQYQSGATLEQIRQRILRQYRLYRTSRKCDVSFYSDFSKTRERIVYRLVSRTRNARLFADVPFVPYLDLALVFCCHVSTGRAGSASIMVRKRHMETWHTTVDELFSLAKENTPRLLGSELCSLKEFLKGFPGGTLPLPGKSPLYILTNRIRSYGACCLLYPHLLQDFAEQKQDDLYVIPSSVHEVMLLPAGRGDSREGLDALVRQVNAVHVAGDEILSDHVYYYSRSAQAFAGFDPVIG